MIIGLKKEAHMVRLFIILSAVGWLLGITVVPATAQNPIDPQRRESILLLMHVTHCDSIGAKVLEQIISCLKASTPNAPEKFWQDIRAGINQDSLLNLCIPIYDKALTDAELKEMTRFFGSAIGKKFVDILPDITAQSMMKGQEWGQQVSLRITREMESQGYLKINTPPAAKTSSPAAHGKTKK
jgi:uncharacterized protein